MQNKVGEIEEKFSHLRKIRGTFNFNFFSSIKKGMEIASIVLLVINI